MNTLVESGNNIHIFRTQYTRHYVTGIEGRTPSIYSNCAHGARDLLKAHTETTPSNCPAVCVQIHFIEAKKRGAMLS